MITSLFGVLRSSRRSSPEMIFWISVLYFVSIPYTFDILFFNTSFSENWQESISDPSYVYYFSSVNFIYMGIFVLLFNIFFLAGSISYKKIAPSPALENHSQEYYLNAIFTIGYLSAIYFLTTYQYPWFYTEFEKNLSRSQEISSILIMCSASACYLWVKKNRYTRAFLAALPSVFVAFVTSERPYLAPVLGAVLCALGARITHDRRGAFTFIAFSLLAIFLFSFARGFATGNLAGLLGLTRDSATNVLYYVFSNEKFFEQWTRGGAFRFLMTTGWAPATLFGERDFASVDIPAMLALYRFKWTFGSIHPTIYGWSFIDMGWWSMLFALALGRLIAFASEFFKSFGDIFFSIWIGAASVFLFVATRGSLQVAYSKSLYILIISVVIALIILGAKRAAAKE